MEFIEKKRILFCGLPFTFTKYTIKDDVITIDAGLLKSTQNDCYMYKIQDVTLNRSLIEKIFHLGTIICRTGDITDPTLSLIHIKNPKVIKDFILSQSEVERRKRRTLNTLDIGVDADDIN
ncbi:MAG: PH domain-containing protein [Lachnotalea sp.]